MGSGNTYPLRWFRNFLSTSFARREQGLASTGWGGVTSEGVPFGSANHYRQRGRMTMVYQVGATAFGVEKTTKLTS
jgi:hypothetical protein